MTPGASRSLTERQAAVMERIDRRVPIKVIADELGVSETRINQHIRTLKNLYGVSNLRDLVDEYRSDQKSNEINSQDDASGEENGPDKGLSEAVYSFNQVPSTAFAFDNSERDAMAALEINDVLPLIEKAPWLTPGEPKVVPRLLDGEHAVMYRLAAIIGIAFAILAALVLTVTASLTISDALDGRATVPVDEKGFTVERA